MRMLIYWAYFFHVIIIRTATTSILVIITSHYHTYHHHQYNSHHHQIVVVVNIKLSIDYWLVYMPSDGMFETKKTLVWRYKIIIDLRMKIIYTSIYKRDIFNLYIFTFNVFRTMFIFNQTQKPLDQSSLYSLHHLRLPNNLTP